MALTYKKIASVTVGSGGAADIEFTSIPNTYTDLVVKLSSRTSYTGATFRFGTLQFNGSSSNLSSRYIIGNGSSVSSGSDTAIYFWSSTADSTASTFNNTGFYIPNYAGSTNKSVSIDTVTENNGTSVNMALVAGLWSDTSAITSIKMITNGGNFVQYSTATLYGILKA